MNPYDYAASDHRFDIRLLASMSQRSHYELTFQSPHRTTWAEGNTAYGDYFTPTGYSPSPLAILVPGLGDDSLIPCLLLIVFEDVRL